jgi:hypothetical protein
MDTERTEVRVTEAVEAVRPEFTPALRQRIVMAIEARAPAPARPRRRWIAVAAGAAAVLIGVGFVPLPAGRTHGVLARAMATLDAGPNIHVVARGWSGEDEYRIEEWSAADGGMRYETWRNGELSHLIIQLPERSLRYIADERAAYEYDMPPMPDRRQILTRDSTRAGFEGRLRFLEDALDATVSERRERSLWGGEVDVIEAQMHVSPGVVLSGVPYDEAGTAILRAEVDPQTGRVRSLREYLETDEGRRPVFETEAIEWDAEIPDSTWTFTPPAGTKVERHTWWATRAGRELAAAQSGDWRVVLHAIDVSRTGYVVLTLSRWLPEAEPDPERRPGTPEARAVDNLGTTYTQDDSRFGCHTDRMGGYWITTLRPSRPAPAASGISLTIGAEAEAGLGHPPVTFHNLPLPPRQQADDLFKAATEVIQY